MRPSGAFLRQLAQFRAVWCGPYGWRGRTGRLEHDAIASGDAWNARLAAHPVPASTGHWKLAVVLAVDEAGVTVGTGQGLTGRISLTELRWARPALKDQRVGATPRLPSEVLSRGDVILVEAIDESPAGPPVDAESHAASNYALRQIPEISGAIVVLNPHTGGVVAMSGGYRFERDMPHEPSMALGAGVVGTAVTGGCIACGAVIGGAVGAAGGYIYDRTQSER